MKKMITCCLALWGGLSAGLVMAEINDGLGGGMPQGHPPMQGRMPAGPVVNNPTPSEDVVGEGKVKTVLEAGNFTYLELEQNGQTVWVAGNAVKVKVGDRVRYMENVRMDNFTSRALNRTFSSVILASSITLVK